jgi:hypothetical protein
LGVVQRVHRGEFTMLRAAFGFIVYLVTLAIIVVGVVIITA